MTGVTGTTAMAATQSAIGTGLTIQAVRTTPVIVPLTRPISTASGSVDSAPLILIDLETREGITGRAYLFSYFPFALKPLDALVRELSAMIVRNTRSSKVGNRRLAPIPRISYKPCSAACWI